LGHRQGKVGGKEKIAGVRVGESVSKTPAQPLRKILLEIELGVSGVCPLLPQGTCLPFLKLQDSQQCYI